MDIELPVALDVMSQQFDGAIPNARVMVKAADEKEAREYKDKLQAIERPLKLAFQLETG